MNRRQKILVVDDDIVSLKHNLILLEGIDADITTASSGEESLSIINKDSDFDLILMDVNMPGIDGFEVAKSLNKSDKTRFIPVIFITSFCRDEIKTIEGLEIGALDYIPKPVSKEIFTRKVKNFLAFQKNKEELSESEQKFKGAFESSAIGIALTSPEGKWLKVNASMTNITGYSESELQNMTWQEITHNDDLEADLDKFYQLIDGKIPHYQMEKRFFHKNGNIVWVVLSIAIIRENRGEPKYFVAQVENITERKSAEEKIQKLLKEKDVLLKEVHHRIKNNMSAISGLLMLHADSSNEISVKNALKDAQSRLQGMSVLYQKLYCSENFLEVSLKDYTYRMIEEIFFAYNVPEYISIDLHIEDIMIPTKISFSLGIIINELLCNIIKYAFKGRTRGRVDISAMRNFNHIVIILEDDGVGMPEFADLNDVSGFGLKLVNMMILQIKGTLKVERGNGSKFILNFPL